MTKKYKFWTGVLAFLPAVVMVGIVFVMVTLMVYGMSQPPGVQSDETMQPFLAIGVTALLFIITAIPSFIFYLLHIINSNSLDSTERVLWIILLFFAGNFAPPVYWYLKIYKSPDEAGQQGFERDIVM